MHVIPQGGAPKKGGPSQVPRLPPLKHTTAYASKRWKILETLKQCHRIDDIVIY